MSFNKNLLIRGGADFSGIQKEMAKTQKTMANFQSSIGSTMKKIGGILVGAFAIKKIWDFGKASVETINNSIEQETKLATVMKQRMNATDEMVKSVKNLTAVQQSLGVISKDNQMTGAQELATYLNQTNTLKTLIPVMNDLVAQQYGFAASGEQVRNMATMMGKIMDGQTGALSRYGFTFTEAEEKIFKYGKEAEKAALLARIVKDSLGNMNAELAKTPQGQMQQLKFKLADIKAEIGTGLLSVIQAVMPYVNAMANALLKAAQAFSVLMQSIFGKAVKVQTKAIGVQSDAVDGLGDAYEGAGKKAKGALAGFDEVNTLSDSSGGGGSNSGTDIGSAATESGDLLGIGSGTIEVSAKVQEMANRVKEIFSDITNTIVQNKETIITALAGISGAFGGYLLITNWTAIVEGLGSAFIGLGTAISGISIPVVLSAAAIGIIIAAIVDLWQKNEEFRNSVIQVWTQIKTFFINVSTDMWNIVKGIWNKYGQTLLNNIGELLENIKKNILIAWNVYILPIINKALSMLTWLWDKHLKGLIEQVGEFIMKCVNGALEIYNKFIAPIVQYMTELFGPTIVNSINFVIDIFGSLLAGVIDVTKGLFKALGGVIDFITGVFTGNWSKAWGGVKDIFKGIFDSLYGIVKVPLNLIVDAINFVIRGLNRISFSMPNWDWIPDNFKGASFGINIQEIPKLAKGGITNGEMLATIGDNPGGREVVSPLDDLLEMISSAVLNANQINNQSNSNQNVEANLYLDGSKFASLIVPLIRKEESRLGKQMIIKTV